LRSLKSYDFCLKRFFHIFRDIWPIMFEIFYLIYETYLLFIKTIYGIYLEKDFLDNDKYSFKAFIAMFLCRSLFKHRNYPLGDKKEKERD